MNDMIMKMDDFGRPAWIALMVASFIVFWPAGLLVLAFLLWSGRMGCGYRHDHGRWQERMAEKFERKMNRFGGSFGGGSSRGGGPASSGNYAFDEYREETLRRLEEEQREFRDFLERLRLAKDRSEFDQFMTERRTKAQGGDAPQSGA